MLMVTDTLYLEGGILVVVDDFTRECLCVVTDTWLSGARVARELAHSMKLNGFCASVTAVARALIRRQWGQQQVRSVRAVHQRLLTVGLRLLSDNEHSSCIRVPSNLEVRNN